MNLNKQLIKVLNEITTVLSSPEDAVGVISTVTKLVSGASELSTGLGFISDGGDLQLVTWKNVDERIAAKIQKMNMVGLFSSNGGFPSIHNYEGNISFRASLTVIFEEEVEDCIIIPLSVGFREYGLIVLVDFKKKNITSQLEDLLLLAGVAAGVALHEVKGGKGINISARVFLMLNFVHFVSKYVDWSGNTPGAVKFLALTLYNVLKSQSYLLMAAVKDSYLLCCVNDGEACYREVRDEGIDFKNMDWVSKYFPGIMSFQGDLQTVYIGAEGRLYTGLRYTRSLSNEEMKLMQSVLGELHLFFHGLDGVEDNTGKNRKYEDFMSRAKKLNLISDNDVLFQTVSREAQALVNAEKSLLIVNDHKTGKLSVLGCSGFDEDEKMLLETGLKQKYCFGNRPLNIIQFMDDPRLSEEFKGAFHMHKVNSMLIIPLKHVDLVDGVLILINKRGKEFSFFNTEDEKFLENLSGIFALALGNSLMRAETEKRMVELVTVNTVAKTIYSRLYLSELLPVLVQIVAKALRARKCWVSMVDESQRGLSTMAAWGLEPVDKRHSLLKINEGIAGLVLQTEKPFLTTGIEEDERLPVLGRKLYEKGSYLAVPIKFQGKVKGVLHVAGKIKGTKFNQNDLNWLVNLTGHIAIGIANAELYESIRAISDGIMKALTKAIEAKDNYTCGHSERVAIFSQLIGEKIGLSGNELNLLRYGGWLHDIGKIGVSEIVLNKPGKLSLEEYSMVRQHPIIGYEILKSIEPLKDVLPLVLHHHEWYNGNGYPNGLKGEEIPITARVMHVADAIDAMTSNRAYRNALDMSTVLDQLRVFSGIQFDPDIVAAVLDTMLFEIFNNTINE